MLVCKFQSNNKMINCTHLQMRQLIFLLENSVVAVGFPLVHICFCNSRLASHIWLSHVGLPCYYNLFFERIIAPMHRLFTELEVMVHWPIIFAIFKVSHFPRWSLSSAVTLRACDVCFTSDAL